MTSSPTLNEVEEILRGIASEFAAVLGPALSGLGTALRAVSDHAMALGQSPALHRGVGRQRTQIECRLHQQGRQRAALFSHLTGSSMPNTSYASFEPQKAAGNEFAAVGLGIGDTARGVTPDTPAPGSLFARYCDSRGVPPVDALAACSVWESERRHQATQKVLSEARRPAVEDSRRKRSAAPLNAKGCPIETPDDARRRYERGLEPKIVQMCRNEIDALAEQMRADLAEAIPAHVQHALRVA